MVVLLVAVALVILVWLGQRWLVYVPDRSAPPPAATVLTGARDVALTTSDGLTLGAWWVPPSAPSRGAVLVAPGNGGNRAGRAGLAEALSTTGLGVLLVDYRGYGGNPGAPSEVGLARDVRAARDFLLDDAGIGAEHLLYLGESIGTGPASALAVEHPPAALVLRSPFTSLADAGRAAYGVPVGWLLRDRYAVADDVRRVDAPVVVVHGGGDTIVPPAQSRAVAQAVRDAGGDVVEVEVPGAGHNDARLAQGPALVSAVADVAARAGVSGCGPVRPR
ncbi:alpha/beta fold hydrolase [Cellulomonas sp. ATA003]|uniref:alpha/beta hydrolase n=1 Tax=Cellulomonas sp. ATA003 TaxID=3073064 RepID=UPI0028735B2A|nr:alpha/beta fold hydrolase [Cellulomonas sp. ATA003]WNB84322.1 alpha/beta fold hydrolase [Cellulomonas sp. ATA003]